MEKYIEGDVKLLGLIGYPIGHTLSPVLINYICKIMNYNYIYLPFQIKPGMLRQAIEGFKSMEVKGLNVTIPYKTDIMNHIDYLSKDAQLIRAVNTIKFEDNSIIGFNTDYKGFSESLKYAGIDVNEKNALVIGGGGAARAIVYALINDKAKNINIINRTKEKAEKIIRDFNMKNGKSFELNYKNLNKCIISSDIIINTTSIGMKHNNIHKLSFDYDLLNENKVVCDIIYNPHKTELLKVAEKRRCKILNGTYMLMLQGVKAFEIWCNKKVPKEHYNDIFTTLENYLKNK